MFTNTDSQQLNASQSLRYHCGQSLGRANAQLLVHIRLTKHNFNSGLGHAKLFGKKSHHVVGGFAIFWRSRHANFQLIALHLANGITFGTGLSKHIQH